MAEGQTRAVVKRGDEVEHEPTDLAPGLLKTVLLGDEERTPHYNMRHFIIEPGETMPKHTNTVEEELYILSGESVFGIGEEEYEVTAGDALLVPAGVSHWWRNEGDESASLICVIPNASIAENHIELVNE